MPNVQCLKLQKLKLISLQYMELNLNLHIKNETLSSNHQLLYLIHWGLKFYTLRIYIRIQLFCVNGSHPTAKHLPCLCSLLTPKQQKGSAAP